MRRREFAVGRPASNRFGGCAGLSQGLNFQWEAAPRHQNRSAAEPGTDRAPTAPRYDLPAFGKATSRGQSPSGLRQDLSRCDLVGGTTTEWKYSCVADDRY